MNKKAILEVFVIRSREQPDLSRIGGRSQTTLTDFWTFLTPAPG